MSSALLLVMSDAALSELGGCVVVHTVLMHVIEHCCPVLHLQSLSLLTAPAIISVYRYCTVPELLCI